MTWMSRLLVVFLLLCVMPSAIAADLAAQRAEFKLAWAAAQQGDLAALTPYLNELADYPLYPYLRYAYLNATLAQQPADVVKSFLNEQAQLPIAGMLRQAWLLELAKQGKWTDFLAQYQNETAPALRCAAVSAHLSIDAKQDRSAWIVAAQHLWLVPYSQPVTCEPAFQYLKAHHRITNGMVEQRVQTALQAGHYTLVRKLLPQLDAVDRPWARIWLDMAADPAQVLETMQVPDEPKYQIMLINGVQLVARTDPERARHLWTVLSRHYYFSHDDAEAMRVHLALEYAWNHLPEAAGLLQQVKGSDNPLVTEWRIRTALRNGKWQTVLNILPALGPLATKPEWRYWRARALAATGRTDQATKIYQSLANGMDYYGFLSADRLNLDYVISQDPGLPAPDVIAQLGARPGFVRAYELFNLQMYRYADAEWLAATASLSKPARCQMALMAQDWGWYGRAIRTLANAGCWQDLNISYPLAFQDVLEPRVRALNLNLPWVYGLIRSESTFNPDAVSPVGALGLMQLMPATGKRVAANLGLVLDDRDALFDPRTNLTLGSAYLDDLLKRFNGSEPLATAAYNAGPRRVNDWLPANANLPADVWVDTIPFWETRSYVRHVLAAAVIFDWRIHGTTERLSARLGTIPSDAALTADNNR